MKIEILKNEIKYLKKQQCTTRRHKALGLYGCVRLFVSLQIFIGPIKIRNENPNASYGHNVRGKYFGHPTKMSIDMDNY